MTARPARSYRPDWFLLGLLAAIALAWLYPKGGAGGGWLRPELINKAGVALVFFLHGAGLSLAALRAGTLQWPLHLVVQGCTFVFFPLLGLLVTSALGGVLPAALSLGVFYLCALPSTVSSSIALTAIARGNVAAAVFNASLSNVLGVFATPLWLTAVVGATGHALPLGPVIRDLALWLLLPLATGQASRRWTAGWLGRHKRGVQAVDRTVILILVYTSFAGSVARGVWSGQSASVIAAAAVLACGLLAAVLVCSHAFTAALGFPVEDRITAVFCGSKKTLAAGVPMAQIVFQGQPGMGLILLPLLIYHPLQLVVCGWLAERWAGRASGPDAPKSA